MANTLTNLIPDLYSALDVVSRELVGMIPAVTLDAQATRAAVNQTVRIPVTPAAAAGNITPAVTPPDDGNQTIANTTVTISKARRVPVRWNGEETLGINSGPGYRAILQAQFAQAMRTLTNEVEADLTALYAKFSRAYGAAGTAPFGTAGDFTAASNVYKILADNGSPLGDLQLVLSTAAGANLRGKQGQAHMFGTDTLLRQGVISDINGMMVRESAQVKAHTKGGGTGYDVDLGAGYGIGDATIHVDGGTVNTTGIKAGDCVTFAGDTNIYVVTTGTTEVEADIVIGEPGLQATLADAVEMTIGNSFTANLAFSKSAIVLCARAPALPDGGDMADDRVTLTDPRSGLTFEVSLYRQYRQIQYEVTMAWGVACIKPEHTAILLG
jgi:hypothetical protein